MIRLIAFDLDGTLMGPDQQIGPRVRRAIEAVQAQGGIVTLATGRMFSAALPFARELRITAPLLAYQGGWIQSPDAPDPLYRVPLPLEVARTVLALAETQHWHTVLYADGQIFMRGLRYPAEFYLALLGPDFHLVRDWEMVLAAHTPDKVLFVADPVHIPSLGRILREQLDGQAQVFRSHARFIEVVPQGVDKGTGLAWLADYLGIPQASVMAVGDQENDLPMVRWAGIGVALGNATPALQRAADWVAPPLDEEGAAAALERFVLREVSSQ